MCHVSELFYLKIHQVHRENIFSVADVEKIFSNKTSSEDFMKIYNRAKPTFTDQIIVYCRTGRRSQIAAETLVDLGYERLVYPILMGV